MSTRSATIFKQTTYWGEKAETEEVLRFYRHCDGYPEGNGLELAKAVANVDRWGVAADYWASGMLGFFLTAGIGIELEPYGCEHGDIEYLYGNRVEELEKKVRRLTPDGYGCIDQHQTCDAVRVEVASTYTLKNIVNNGMELNNLRKAHAMDNDELWAWATKRYRSTSYGSMSQPIEVSYHKYQYTLTFNETRGCHTYVTDGNGNAELIEIDLMEEQMVDNLNQWCRVEYIDKLKLAALSELRGYLEVVIADLEKKEQ